MGVKVTDERPVRGQAPRRLARLDLRLRAPARGGCGVPGRRRPRDVPGRLRARLARRCRERRLQPARAQRPADRARDHGAARDREVPAPGGEHVQPDVHGGRALGAPTDRAAARRALPSPPRPGPLRGHRREGARARERDRSRGRRGREPRRGPDPARLPARRPSRPAHELLPDRRRGTARSRTCR